MRWWAPKLFSGTVDRAKELRSCGGDNKMNFRYVPTIVIGGGQAGLTVGHYLAKRRIPFVILDAHPRVGDAWRNRWDSLRLFSPARYSGLPGLRFPAPGGSLPTKQQMADYLEEYATRFQLPVINNVKVDRLWKEGARFQLAAGKQRFEADNVIVAMANYQHPRVPAFARELDPRIVQLHSHDYKNPSQLQEGGVLVVGVGNSGGDIAIEVARTHRTWSSGKESGHIPWPIDTYISRNFLSRLVRFVGHHVLTVKTRMGRKARPKLLHQATPLIRVKPQDLENAGITRVQRVVGVNDGRPLIADGSTLDVRNVIWCTGYEHNFPWIDLPVFETDGEPMHEEGVVPSVPGLYFVGLHFLYAMSSATLIGIGRDSKRVVKALAKRARSGEALQPVKELQPETAATEEVRIA